jgi:cell wall assembly regulator SMI1
MNKHLEELGKLIKEKNPQLHNSLETGVPDLYMEAEFGPLYDNLPDDLKALWNWHNGQIAGFECEFNPKSHEKFLSVDDSAETIETLNDSTEVGVLAENNWQEDWIPFTEDMKGNYFCVATQTGEVFYFDRNVTSTGVRYASVTEWMQDTIKAYESL